jgi:hypothetical protein
MKLADQIAEGHIVAIPREREVRTQAMGLGPRAALRRANLGSMSCEKKKAWIEEARLDALLGHKTATLRSLRSGVACYITFAGKCFTSTRSR